MAIKEKESLGNLMIPSLDILVKKDHPYRKLIEMVDFEKLCSFLKDYYSPIGQKGHHPEMAFKALLLQWMEDLSDRELERFLEENNAAKWFCGFSLIEKTPDHTFFCRFRKKIGTEAIGKLFHKLKEAITSKGFATSAFTVIDSSALVSKFQLWEERDRILEKKEKKLSNANVSKVAADPEAKIGCKGKRKFWYGYKRHVAIDCKYGLITKVAVTAANVPDGKALKHVCPNQGMVIADKAYSSKDTRRVIRSKNCHPGVILKNNSKEKNRDKDRWLSSVRAPYESTFSKMSNKARYRGKAKMQFQVFMEALAYNFKKMLRLGAPVLIT